MRFAALGLPEEYNLLHKTSSSSFYHTTIKLSSQQYHAIINKSRDHESETICTAFTLPNTISLTPSTLALNRELRTEFYKVTTLLHTVGKTLHGKSFA